MTSVIITPCMLHYVTSGFDRVMTSVIITPCMLHYVTTGFDCVIISVIITPCILHTANVNVSGTRCSDRLLPRHFPGLSSIHI